MSHAPHPPDPRRIQEIESLLDSLRARIRLYVWLEGLAVAAAWLGVAFWLSLLIDQPWFWEPSRLVRGGILAVVGAMFAFLLVRLIGQRAFVPLRRRSMALLLERRFGRFGDALLTSVELSERDALAAGYSPQMLAETRELARQGTGDVALGQVFNLTPLASGLTAAGVLALSVLLFALLAPQAWGIWARRCLMLSDEMWPRKTELVVDGFRDNVARIARGSDFELIVRANTEKVVPSAVQVRYRTDEGFRGRENLSRDGIARPGVDPYQRFSHTFHGVLTPIRLDVLGGDDRKRDLRIEVVDSPALADLRLMCRFPAYMQRDPQELPVTGPMQLPEGTQVTVLARANKDLVEVQVREPVPLDERPAPATDEEADESGEDDPEAESTRAALVIRLAGTGGDPRLIELPLDVLTADRTLLFTLVDADGLTSREPIRLSLGVTPDQPPEVALQLRGIGSAVTPEARLPVEGEMLDDYGLAEAWFEYTLDEAAEPSRLPLGPRTNRSVKLSFGQRGRRLLKLA